MPVASFVPSPVQGITGPGPYRVSHAYAAGDIGAIVLWRSMRVELTEAEFRMVPPASSGGGDLLLSPEVAERYAGGLLIPYRDSRIEQGWAAAGGRGSLEVQLDLIVRALQDQSRRLDAALRLDLPVAPLSPPAGRPLVGTGEGGFDWGPTTLETAETAAAIVSEEGIVALPAPWPGKADFLAARLNPATRAVRVVAEGLELVYLRDPAGATVQADGSRWRLVSGADYPNVASLISARYRFDPGDRIRAGGFGYVTLAADEATPDLTTQGGTPLAVEPDDTGRVHLDAFGAAGDGRTDDTAALTRAIARGKVRLGPRFYAVNGIQPVSGMHIEGEGGSIAGRRYGLVCNVAGGTIFRDDTSEPIYTVRLENFCATAGAAGVTFYDSPSQKKYTGGYRIRGLELTNEFALLFRCVPIYWIIEDCRFGFQGGRRGGAQEFRIFEAWCDSTACPVNLNKVINTTHYHCAAGKTFFAAYTLRCGASWTFENCSAEQFDSAAVVDARSFSTVQWLGGWIEHISHAAVFHFSVDTKAPFTLNGTPIAIEGTKFYIGSKTCRHLVANRNGFLSVRNLNILGHDPAFRIATNPERVALYRNIYHGDTTAVAAGIQEQGQVHMGRLSPWRNGIPPERLTVIGSTRIEAMVSGLSAEATSLLHPGSGLSGVALEVPVRLLRAVRNGSVTVVAVGAWETDGPKERMVRAAYWSNAAPTARASPKIAPPEQALARTDTGLGSTRLTCFVPGELTSFHIGLLFENAGRDAAFSLEGLHLLVGDVICSKPFFV